MKIAEQESMENNFTDTFIREVRVSYLPITTKRFAIREPVDVARFVRNVLIDNTREQFVAMYLNGAHHVASFSIISIGTANQAAVHPREVFQRAVLVGAIALTIAHNHPSGSLEASKADVEITNRLKEAGQLLGIQLLDHVICTDEEHLSLREDSRCWA